MQSPSLLSLPQSSLPLDLEHLVVVPLSIFVRINTHKMTSRQRRRDISTRMRVAMSRLKSITSRQGKNCILVYTPATIYENRGYLFTKHQIGGRIVYREALIELTSFEWTANPTMFTATFNHIEPELWMEGFYDYRVRDVRNFGNNRSMVFMGRLSNTTAPFTVARTLVELI